MLHIYKLYVFIKYHTFYDNISAKHCSLSQWYAPFLYKNAILIKTSVN